MGRRKGAKKGKGKASASMVVTPRSALSQSSITATSYKGGIWLPGSLEQERVIAQNMLFSQLLSSSAAGSFFNSYGTNLVTNCTNWTAMSAVYDEYRVLAFEVEFFPSNRYSRATTTVTFPGVGVVDHDNAAPLVSVASGMGYESARMLSLDDPWTDRKEYRGSSVPSLKWHMSGIDEAPWLNVQAASSIAAYGGIKLAFDNLSASTTYGRAICRFLVQFKGTF